MTFPKLIVNQNQLKENGQRILKGCQEAGIHVAAVVKGVNGSPQMIQNLLDLGLTIFASSRLRHLQTARDLDPNITSYALRIPMHDEIEDLVDTADISLNSDLETVRQINQVCRQKDKTHQVMVELGDLREGVYDDQELVHMVKTIEEDLDYVHLRGIATNLGCYGSILPTPEKTQELVDKADLVNQAIGREIDYISGGATTTYPLVARGVIPKAVNEMRIGTAFFINDYDPVFEYKFHDHEAISIQAQIIEIKDKPTYPIGTIGINAFGEKPHYEDRGIRKRAIIAVGRQDIGDCSHLLPFDDKIEIVGGSSDHTILDIQDSSKDYQVGDIVDFHMEYETMMMAFQSQSVEKVFE